MKLRGIGFGKVLSASGAQGFFGEGYWFHPYLHPFGLNFHGVTFVAKTTTLHARQGNLPLKEDFSPRELTPSCIIVKLWQGIMLNAVGLSGPGAKNLFWTGNWQRREKPFFLSFMSIAASAKERAEELLAFTKIFAIHLPYFRTKVGLQINYSCPNVGLHPDALLDEVGKGLSIASRLGIPLMPKFNLLIPVELARDISSIPSCDALCISNTIPYGQLPDRINWQKLFGPISPLQKYGGGGLSGKPLLPLLLEWLEKAHQVGLAKPLNAGGGILSLADAKQVMDRGAASVFLGSIASLRPWRVAKIARTINDD
ncbi:MAG: hypothetical protein NTW60_01765 [Candidatus Wolfebacteria bacterium]|nr:hypothetical protein [Candidatus Wolfebacteria bacterium]